MKTTKHVFGLVIAILIGFTACNDESEEVIPTDVLSDEVEVAEDVTDAESQFEDLDDLATDAFESGTESGGRLEEDDERVNAECVTMTWTDSTLTIDYGTEGCLLPNGQTRKGKIHITWTGRKWEPGSAITWEAEDLFINDNEVLGKRVLTNLNDSRDEAPHHQIELLGGQIIYSDGTTATREVDRERIWYREANPLNDEVHILEGSIASGKTRRDVNYTSLVLEDLVYKRDCRVDGRRRFIPVAGVKQITKEGEIFTIDFGDGECDTLITVTDSEGNEREVDLLNL